MDITEIKNKLLIFSNGLKIKKYKLCKENQNVKYKVYTSYPTINNDYNLDDIKNKINQYLIKYYEIMIKSFPSNYLSIFYKNISTTKYKEGLNIKDIISSLWGIITGMGTTEGYYYGYENTVYAISKKQKDFLVLLSHGEKESYDDIINNTLSHEIFHIATYITDDNVMYDGFYQNSGTYEIGLGVNEGYTELLARRYFEKETGYYDDEVIIASLVEDIVSKDKMEHLYFFADLKGLMAELNKYTDYKSVNRFILDFDTYCHNQNDKALLSMFKFIMEAHKNKILKDNNVIDKDRIIEEYNQNLMSKIIKKH